MSNNVQNPWSQVAKDQVIDLTQAQQPSACSFCEDGQALLNTVHLQICTNDLGIQSVFVERLCEPCKKAVLEDNFPGVVVLAI